MWTSPAYAAACSADAQSVKFIVVTTIHMAVNNPMPGIAREPGNILDPLLIGRAVFSRRGIFPRRCEEGRQFCFNPVI